LADSFIKEGVEIIRRGGRTRRVFEERHEIVVCRNSRFGFIGRGRLTRRLLCHRFPPQIIEGGVIARRRLRRRRLFLRGRFRRCIQKSSQIVFGNSFCLCRGRLADSFIKEGVEIIRRGGRTRRVFEERHEIVVRRNSRFGFIGRGRRSRFFCLRKFQFAQEPIVFADLCQGLCGFFRRGFRLWRHLFTQKGFEFEIIGDGSGRRSGFPGQIHIESGRSACFVRHIEDCFGRSGREFTRNFGARWR
ncbi:MAG: hypothetical protein O2807_12970, partial [bacterium]|nr:hypothetical protein [bacterium]